jgi:hypothetical protein
MTNKTKSKPSKPIDWPAVRLTFIGGNMSVPEHAATYGVTVAAMRQRVARGKWLNERRKLSKNVTTFALSSLTKTKGTELAEFDAADARLSSALRDIAAKMLADAMAPDAKKLTPSEARTIASLAETAQKIGRIALGGTTENHGVSGVSGAPPVMVGTLDHAARVKAMNDYLHPF